MAPSELGSQTEQIKHMKATELATNICCECSKLTISFFKKIGSVKSKVTLSYYTLLNQINVISLHVIQLCPRTYSYRPCAHQ